MIYVDCSQLSRFVRNGKPVSGIQRLTLNSVVGLHDLLGDEQVRTLVYDEVGAAFRCISVGGLFAGEKGEFVIFRKDDCLLLMEWYWSQTVFEAGLKAGKSDGVKYFRFIHDVIPVARPEFVRPSNTRQFRANTELALCAANVILTNSDFSKQDILKHFPISKTRPIKVLKLAHEFAVIDAGGKITKVGAKTEFSNSDPKITGASLRNQKFVLMVGTLEKRKNTLLAVKVWQRLRRKHGSKLPKLVLVGFYSAHSLPYTASLILRTALNQNIIHLSNCSDTELAWLYQRCLFSIYISQYEGWGLSIGESLWFGKPVVTQNNSSLPEVGGELVDMVDSKDLKALEGQFERLIFDLDYRNQKSASIAAAPLRDWKQFAELMAQSLINS